MLLAILEKKEANKLNLDYMLKKTSIEKSTKFSKKLLKIRKTKQKI
jgi:hypothetical protein